MDTRGLLHHPPAWLGRRGTVLLLLGIIWCLIGSSILGADLEAPDSSAILHLLIPVPIRVTLWVGTGIIAMLGAVYERPRWERYGYMALVLMPLERIGSYAWSWIVYLATEGDLGYGRGGISALTWGVIFLLIVTIAGWEESPRATRVDTAIRKEGAT